MSKSDEMIAALDSTLFSSFPDLEIKGLRIRSDNRSQLTSNKYENLLRLNKDGIYNAVKSCPVNLYS